jgi:RNA polymerase sigma-70 factor (ECF subfamily)
MMRPDINRAIEAVLRGDRNAFSVIIETFNDELWRLVSYYLPDRTRVEDVVQRSFVNAYVSLESFETGRNFGAWIRSIAHNESKKELRAMLSDKARATRYAERLALEAVADDRYGGFSEKRLRYLNECIGLLPSRARRLLRVRYELGKSIQRIAEDLQRSRVAIQKALSRVRLNLRECIGEKELADGAQ